MEQHVGNLLLLPYFQPHFADNSSSDCRLQLSPLKLSGKSGITLPPLQLPPQLLSNYFRSISLLRKAIFSTNSPQSFVFFNSPVPSFLGLLWRLSNVSTHSDDSMMTDSLFQTPLILLSLLHLVSGSFRILWCTSSANSSQLHSLWLHCHNVSPLESPLQLSPAGLCEHFVVAFSAVQTASSERKSKKTNLCVCFMSAWSREGSEGENDQATHLHTFSTSFCFADGAQFPRPSYGLIAVTSRHTDCGLLPKRCYIFVKARPEFPTARYLCHRRSYINSFCSLSLPSLIFFLIKTWVFFFSSITHALLRFLFCILPRPVVCQAAQC